MISKKHIIKWLLVIIVFGPLMVGFVAMLMGEDTIGFVMLGFAVALASLGFIAQSLTEGVMAVVEDLTLFALGSSMIVVGAILAPYIFIWFAVEVSLWISFVVTGVFMVIVAFVGVNFPLNYNRIHRPEEE